MCVVTFSLIVAVTVRQLVLPACLRIWSLGIGAGKGYANSLLQHQSCLKQGALLFLASSFGEVGLNVIPGSGAGVIFTERGAKIGLKTMEGICRDPTRYAHQPLGRHQGMASSLASITSLGTI